MLIGTIHYKDPTVMAGVGLGNMTKVLLGTTLMYGVNGGIDTYVSQAAGAK